jgi:glycosyltransferase involved in cell wall biosynthesis
MLLRAHHTFPDLETTASQWSADAREIVKNLGTETRARFSEARPSDPAVIIPAHKEEGTLPATLLALSQLDHPVHPIVAENGNSPDRTLEVAEEMGAHVISRAHPSKMSGIKGALEYMDVHLPDAGRDPNLGLQVIFETDADTRVYEGWVDSGLEKVQKIGGACVIFGLVFFRGRWQKLPVNTARNAVVNGKQVASTLIGLRPGSRGANMVMALDHDGVMMERIMEAPDTAVEDRAIRSIFNDYGEGAFVNLDWRARVDTPDDRYPNLRTYVKSLLGKLSPEEIYNTGANGQGDVGLVDYEGTTPK